jgi:hypothetical protein
MDIQNLHEYFGIPSTKEDKISISLKIKETDKTIYLQIIYSHDGFNLNDHNILELPSEINNIIHSYLSCYIEINTNILYIDTYPFSPPQWNLLSVINKSSSRINLHEYYEYIVKCHNSQYSINWSPAIIIEKDILFFITRINLFQEILNN